MFWNSLSPQLFNNHLKNTSFFLTGLKFYFLQIGNCDIHSVCFWSSLVWVWLNLPCLYSWLNFRNSFHYTSAQVVSLLCPFHRGWSHQDIFEMIEVVTIGLRWQQWQYRTRSEEWSWGLSPIELEELRGCQKCLFKHGFKPSSMALLKKWWNRLLYDWEYRKTRFWDTGRIFVVKSRKGAEWIRINIWWYSGVFQLWLEVKDIKWNPALITYQIKFTVAPTLINVWFFKRQPFPYFKAIWNMPLGYKLCLQSSERPRLRREGHRRQIYQAWEI